MSCAAPHRMHWESLRSTPPERIAAQPGVTSRRDGPGWEVPFLTWRYAVDPEREQVREVAPLSGAVPAPDLQILLIRYLLSPGAGPLCGEEVSEKELPGGVTFFRGPHALQVAPILARFGRDARAFVDRGLALGGERRGEADGAIRLWPFPEVPVSLLLWQGDAEFPASLSVLFDRSITRWFELDMVFLLVGILARRYAGNG